MGGTQMTKSVRDMPGTFGENRPHLQGYASLNRGFSPQLHEIYAKETFFHCKCSQIENLDQSEKSNRFCHFDDKNFN